MRTTAAGIKTSGDTVSRVSLASQKTPATAATAETKAPQDRLDALSSPSIEPAPGTRTTPPSPSQKAQPVVVTGPAAHSSVPTILSSDSEPTSRAGWQAEIDRICAVEDPVLANVRITVAHSQLSKELSQVVGKDAGANFHTWATWGSKKAGISIRNEDIPQARLAAVAAGATLGLAGGVVGSVLGGIGTYVGTRFLEKRVTEEISQGNRIVLEEIGKVTARFVDTFADSESRDPDKLKSFRASFPEGQELLRDAFTNYYEAKFASDPKEKHERMYMGNLQAILHEQRRLQPHFEKALPPGMRRISTRFFMPYRLAGQELRVAQDVPKPFPATLQKLDSDDLNGFLKKWDRTPNTTEGSGARSWVNIHDRMNYIVDLFRAEHASPELFSEPYTPVQTLAIQAGHMPPGPL